MSSAVASEAASASVSVGSDSDESRSRRDSESAQQSKPPLLKNLSFIDFLGMDDNELEFDMGVLELPPPHHGLHHFKGLIPLFKRYTPPDLEKMSEVDATLQGWVRKVQIPWTKKEIAGSGSFIKTAIAATAFFNPKDAITEPAMVGAAGFCLCIIYLDDILDKSGSFGGAASSSSGRRRSSISALSASPGAGKGSGSNSYEFTNIFLNTVFNILDGQYNDMEELPTIMPALDPVYKLLLISYEHGVKSLPFYNNENCKYLREAFVNDSISALLMKDCDYGPFYSDEVYRLLRPRDGGFYTVIELILIGRGIVLRSHIRKHPLFKIIMYLSASVLGFTNDLFGLEKEVHDGNDNDNLVLRIARNKPIGEAFKEVNEIIKNQRKDIELTAEKLMEEFAHHETDSYRLTEFIDILQTFLDGHVYFSQYSERYGKFTLKPASAMQ